MNDTMFALADELKNLREQKSDAEAVAKDLTAQIDKVEAALVEQMTEAECCSFTRGDKQFILTTTTRWSAEQERKDDLYAALRKNGFDHLFTVNVRTLGSFVREQVQETADENGETHVPEWLCGLVKSYDDTGITVRKATKH